MTPVEIVKALRRCGDGNCTGCILRSDKQHCQECLLGSAAVLIERLEKEKAAAQWISTAERLPEVE